jgi:hypothetical protein
LYIAVPIVTYILGPCTTEELPGYENVDLSSGGELCENITYLGGYLHILVSEYDLNLSDVSFNQSLPESRKMWNIAMPKWTSSGLPQWCG